eukprot:1735251-Amphidinium_carterae.1
MKGCSIIPKHCIQREEEEHDTGHTRLQRSCQRSSSLTTAGIQAVACSLVGFLASGGFSNGGFSNGPKECLRTPCDIYLFRARV